MEVITKETVHKEKSYIFTEEELKAIKMNARKDGQKDVILYIAFCISNFSYQLNFGGVLDFFSKLSDFIMGFENCNAYISNTKDIRFDDYIKKYRT